MYCPSCANEITVELKYCNRCGANLALPATTMSSITMMPVKLTVPSIVLGLTVFGGLGIIFGAATQFASLGIHPVALIWITLFGTAALFGCISLMIRFWLKVLTLQRGIPVAQIPVTQVENKAPTPTLLPHYDSVASVTENTTRTFTPVYSEPYDRRTDKS